MTVVESITGPAAVEWARRWRAWRAERERGLRDPHGWLSLTGLHWLDAEPSTIDGLPGRWSADGSSVTVHADAVDDLRLDAAVIDGVARVEPAEGAPGVRVAAAELRIEVIRRDGRFAVRVRDPRSPALARFAGVPTFPPDPAWVLTGRFEPYDGPRPVVVGSVVDGLTHRLSTVGVVRGERDGRPFALTASGTRDDPRVTFRDATSGVSTSASARSLTVGRPDADGRVVLDFNRAVNLPCAFTEYATCPLPPPENVLPFAVEAGEQTPH